MYNLNLTVSILISLQMVTKIKFIRQSRSKYSKMLCLMYSSIKKKNGLFPLYERTEIFEIWHIYSL